MTHERHFAVDLEAKHLFPFSFTCVLSRATFASVSSMYEVTNFITRIHCFSTSIALVKVSVQPSIHVPGELAGF